MDFYYRCILNFSGGPDESSQWSGCERHGSDQRKGGDRHLHHQGRDHLLLRGRTPGGPIQLSGQLARHQTAPGTLILDQINCVVSLAALCKQK